MDMVFTKGNVLLQYFGITNKQIPFIAERNEKKFNHYTPGTKIKIISESSSRKMKPDFYLVLPWHFKREIYIEKLKSEKKELNLFFHYQRLKFYKTND